LSTTHDLRVVVVRRGHDVVGLLPLEWERDGATRTVSLTGAWTGADHLDVVAGAAHAGTVADAALGHLARRRDWDRIRFDGVAAGGELSRALGRWRLRTPWLRHRSVVLRPAPCLRLADLPGDGGSVAAIRAKTTRRTTRASMRRIHEGGGGLVMSERPDDVLADLDGLMRLHRSQFGARSVVMATELRRDFHRTVAARLAAQGRVRTWRLVDDGRVLKYGYGFVTGATLAAYQTARVGPDTTRVRSPGVVATAALIDRAAADGFTVVDFLRGDQPHKLLFATEVRTTERHEVLRPSPATAALVATAGTRKLRQRVRRSGSPR
jgi:CelD/BcsL family acetyltransferase involved in cellulose biosynthesis